MGCSGFVLSGLLVVMYLINEHICKGLRMDVLVQVMILPEQVNCCRGEGEDC